LKGHAPPFAPVAFVLRPIEGEVFEAVEDEAIGHLEANRL
jgi:hypothetical protein